MQPAPRYTSILQTARPFLVAQKASLPYLNLAPMGIPIAPDCIFDPTELRSRSLIDGLHALDGATFGPADMLMPRWVLFDCGEMPGIIFGFLRPLSELPKTALRVYGKNLDGLVPISMWVGIPCIEPGTWFGHNLSSINVALSQEKIPGLAMLTKVMAIAVARAKKQQGATQWNSLSITTHAAIGEMLLLSAYTPAHTYPETLCYSIDIHNDTLFNCLKAGAEKAEKQYNRKIDPNDENAIQQLQIEIENGARIYLTGAERSEDGEIKSALLHQR